MSLHTIPSTPTHFSSRTPASHTRRVVNSAMIAVTLLLQTPNAEGQFVTDAHSQNIVSIARLGQQIAFLMRDMESKPQIPRSDLDKLSQLLALWWPQVVESRRANFAQNLSLAESARGILVSHGYSARELPQF